MSIGSKVLLYETSDEHMQQLKSFFQEKTKLTGLRTRSYGKLKELLRVNTDLGGVFLGRGENGEESMEKVASEIRYIRPELPIFLREEKGEGGLDQISPSLRKGINLYEEGNMDQLKDMIDQYIFNLKYPNLLVRGIQEISNDVLESIFPWKVVSLPPYLVRDRFIYGSLFSMIPLVSNWCNGYMVIEAKACDMAEDIGKNAPAPQKFDFRKVNGLLGEITNRIWGGIKVRFISDEKTRPPHHIQVPILVNHEHKHLSFGTGNPQLCFRYTLYHHHDILPAAEIYQKFVFHLSWTPEDFSEQSAAVESMVESGEIELF